MNDGFKKLEDFGFQIIDRNYGIDIARKLFSNEVEQLTRLLIETPLDFDKHLMQAGGNKSPYTGEIEQKFYEKGWQKDNIIVYRSTSFKNLDIKNEFETISHEIDHIIVNGNNKCIALEIEWNTHKVFMNRDTQFWQEGWNLGAIDLAILITFGEELQNNLKKNILKFFKENLKELSELEINNGTREFSLRMMNEKNIEFNFPTIKQFKSLKTAVKKGSDLHEEVADKFYSSKFGGTASVIELNKILDKGYLGRTPFIVIGLPDVGSA